VTSPAHTALTALCTEVARIGGHIEAVECDKHAFCAIMGTDAGYPGSAGALVMPNGGVRVVLAAGPLARWRPAAPEVLDGLDAAIRAIEIAHRREMDEPLRGSGLAQIRARESLTEARSRCIEALMWAERAAKP
jgi:hypothetical protein